MVRTSAHRLRREADGLATIRASLAAARPTKQEDALLARDVDLLFDDIVDAAVHRSERDDELERRPEAIASCREAMGGG
jgi:hypothetical protein